MIITYAWRNVWRNSTRSLAVILALATGLLGALFIAAMANGMMDKWVNTAIDNEISDIQIHHKEYLITEELATLLMGIIDKKAVEFGPDVFEDFLQFSLLQVLDDLWRCTTGCGHDRHPRSHGLDRYETETFPPYAHKRRCQNAGEVAVLHKKGGIIPVSEETDLVGHTQL